MEAVTRYKAADGSEWQSKDDCMVREQMIADVREIMALLKPTPTELNWKGYVQQHGDAVLSVQASLFDIANRDEVLKWWIDPQINDRGRYREDLIYRTHPSWFVRMLDGAHAPLGRAYHRLSCIDGDFREWNQPFFALHRQHGYDFCVD